MSFRISHDGSKTRKNFALIKEQYCGESVHLEGIGTFTRIHESQHFSRDEKRRTVAHPPNDTIHFSPDELGKSDEAIRFHTICCKELSISEEESQKLLSEFSFHISNELNKTNKAQLTGLGVLKKDTSGIIFELDPPSSKLISSMWVCRLLLYQMILTWLYRKNLTLMSLLRLNLG